MKCKVAIGYIKLPRFYADFNGTTGRSCSKDVAKEIKKLKDQKVKGIILDNKEKDTESEKFVLLVAKTLKIPAITHAQEALDILKDEHFVTLDPKKKLVYEGLLEFKK